MTLQAEWAHALPYSSSEERKRWLTRYLTIYNDRTFHKAIGGRTPSQQLNRLRVTERPFEKKHLGACRA